MARVTAASLALLTALASLEGSAAARPPFPYELYVHTGCERSELAADGHDVLATTCLVGVDLMRAGPATLVLELAGSDATDDGPLGERDVVTWAGVFGLDLNFGRTHGDLGLEVLLRMMILSAEADGAREVEPFPFASGTVRMGLGWRWLEVGGTPWPHPGESRMAYLGYGMDLYHWTMGVGLGLFGAMTLSPDGALDVIGVAFGAYGEVLGRVGDLRVGLRAALGGEQAFMLTLGWQQSLL